MPDLNNNRHTFSFEGGDKLTTIGATFLVSYLYYQHVDPSHSNWANIKTHRSRINTINSSVSYHHQWLCNIDQMSEANLNRNTLGLKGEVIKNMATAILKAL